MALKLFYRYVCPTATCATVKFSLGNTLSASALTQLPKPCGDSISLTLRPSCHFTKISQQFMSLLDAKTGYDYINLVFLGKWIKTFVMVPGSLTGRKEGRKNKQTKTQQLSSGIQDHCEHISKAYRQGI